MSACHLNHLSRIKRNFSLLLGVVLISPSLSSGQDIDASQHHPMLMTGRQDNERTNQSSMLILAHQRHRELWQQIDRQLNSSTEIRAINAPLADVLNHFAEMHQIPISIDQFGLDEMGIDPSQPVSVDASAITLGQALEEVLQPFGLVAVVDVDELLITSVESGGYPKMHRKLYFVGDIDLFQKTEIRVVYSREGGGEHHHLVQFIKDTVTPDNWSDVGGLGSIEVYDDTLVIGQSLEELRRIDGLLEQLREYQSRLAALESDASGDDETVGEPTQDQEPRDETSVRVYKIVSQPEIGGDGSASFTPVDGTSATFLMADGTLTGGTGWPNDSMGPRKEIASKEELVELIPVMIQSESWEGSESIASIQIAGDSIVIRQTQEAHREITQLLDGLGVLQNAPLGFGASFGSPWYGQGQGGGLF